MALQDTFVAAKSEGRNLSIQEIIGKHIPYLDAAIEEVLRCAGTASVVDRQTLVDTEILGYQDPKGTIVTCFGDRAEYDESSLCNRRGTTKPD